MSAPEQGYVHLDKTNGSGKLTVTAPSDAKLAPPAYYMLFICSGLLMTKGGITFHHDRPNCEAPQTMLLVTPSEFRGNRMIWLMR